MLSPFKNNYKHSFIIFIAATWMPFLTACHGRSQKTISQTPVHVDKAGQSRSILPSFLGYNNNFIWTGSWRDEPFLDVLKTFKPQALRYPGGTWSNYWDWETGWFLKDLDVGPRYVRNIKPNPSRLEDLKVVIDRTGATPVFVVNIMTRDLKSQLAMLEHAQMIGLPIKFVELGNEADHPNKFYTSLFPDGQTYARKANRWIKAIKNRFPKVQIAVAAASPYPTEAQRRQQWNEQMYPLLEGADAAVFHVYAYPSGYLSQQAKALAKSRGIEPLGKPRPGPGMVFTLPEQQASVDILKRPGSMAYVLGVPFGRMKLFTETEYLPAGMSCWITEYNLFDNNGAFRGRWSHGLATATMTLLLMERPQVQMLLCHALYGNTLFASIFWDKPAFDHLSEQVSSQTLGLSAQGETMQVIGHALEGMSHAQQLSFSPAHMISPNKATAYPSLLGWEFSYKKQTRVLILNLSPTDQPISLKQMGKPNALVWQKFDDPMRLISGFKHQAPSSIQKQVADHLVLPAYSITLIK